MPAPNPERIERLKKSLKTGHLTTDHVRLAAFLRDPDASVALGEPVDPEPDLVAWAEALRSGWGEQACGRATIAWARAALIRWEKRPLPKEDLRRRLNRRPYEILNIAEQLMVGPQMYTTLMEGKRLRNDTIAERNALDDQEKFRLQASVLSLALNALEANGSSWNKSFYNARQDIRIVWPNEIRIRRIVEIELVPWTLKEGDPLRKRPTKIPD